jgi:hypothetical protein
MDRKTPAPVAMQMPTGDIDTAAVMALIVKQRSDFDNSEQ